MFDEILSIINNSDGTSFEESCVLLEEHINSDSDFIGTLRQIGILSRTAKNQKDFKVSALSAWRKDNDYAVLCAPYFQYPAKNSQIYSQALSNNVCLLSYEQISFIIERSSTEKSYWLDRIGQIKNYSREQAVNELIKSLGIHEKIAHIDSYVKSLQP